MAAAAPSEDDVEIFKDVSDDDRQKTDEENSTDVGPKAKRARAKGKAKAKGQAETDDTEEPQSRSAGKAGGKGTGGGKGGNHVPWRRPEVQDDRRLQEVQLLPEGIANQFFSGRVKCMH